MANVLAETLHDWNYTEVSPMEFYRSVFPEGELDTAGALTKGKYAGIAVEICAPTAEGYTDVKRYSVLDDLSAVEGLLSSPNFCVLAPISYAGKSRKSANARLMYALVVELDGLVVDHGRQSGLINLLAQTSSKVEWLPQPTYLVASGAGLHLYYVFEFPVPLFPNVVKSLMRYKRRLTKKIWNRHVTTLYRDKDIQQESIFQAFRMVGTRTKLGDTVRAFEVGDVVTIEYLNRFVEDEDKIVVLYKSELNKADARRLYPDWYERRVVKKQPKGRWTCNRAVYDWWKRRITAEAGVGHRYYCLMCLAIYAIKCEIEYEELKNDCFELMGLFEELTDDEKNHFTEKDVLDALQSYQDAGLVTYPVNSIANRSGIKIEKNKRNGFSRAESLRIARLVQSIKYKNKDWREGNGRPEKSELVSDWRRRNPDGRKIDCHRDTGLSRVTIDKWWDTADTLPSDGGKEAPSPTASGSPGNALFRRRAGDREKRNRRPDGKSK